MKKLLTGILFLQLFALTNPSTAQSVNEYPNMRLVMESSVQNAKELKGKNIFIVYFPDCDHCQREATEISSHLKAFKKYQLWFISSTPISSAGSFAKKYNLTGHNNIHFAHVDAKDVISNFGGIPTPSVFIYSENKQLVKAIKGETKVEEIIKFL